MKERSSVRIQADEMDRIKRRINEILVQHTGQPMATVEKDTDRDFFLTAEQAKGYGLIDAVEVSRSVRPAK